MKQEFITLKGKKPAKKFPWQTILFFLALVLLLSLAIVIGCQNQTPPPQQTTTTASSTTATSSLPSSTSTTTALSSTSTSLVTSLTTVPSNSNNTTKAPAKQPTKTYATLKQDALVYSSPTPLNTASKAYLHPGAVNASYLNDAVCIGDSITQGMGLYMDEWFDRVLGARSLNVDTIFTGKVKVAGKSMTILNAIKQIKPGKIYIMIGTNGISWMSNSYMTGQLSKFIDECRKIVPNAKIILEAIPPASREKAASNKAFRPSKIDSYNKALLTLAEQKNAYFLDVNRLFRDSQGYLPSNETPDGIHFYAANYRKWVNLLSCCIPDRPPTTTTKRPTTTTTIKPTTTTTKPTTTTTKPTTTTTTVEVQD